MGTHFAFWDELDDDSNDWANRLLLLELEDGDGEGGSGSITFGTNKPDLKNDTIIV